MPEQQTNTKTLNPKKLFLIDAFGALVSAFLLGVILVKYEKIFGIPATTLYFLAILPLLFMVYDIYSYRKKIASQIKLLKGISIINVSYCILSLGFAFYHIESITIFGWIYILIEITIVLFLAYIQHKFAEKLSSKKVI